MKRILMTLLLVVAGIARADEASVQFEQANQLYRTSEYNKAVELYEHILSNGYESPSLYFNLGNTRFKLNDIPSAILNYERAKRLAPHDEDIAYNLRLANLRVVDKIEPIPSLFFVEWWRSTVNLASSDGWGVSAIAGLWLTVICGAIMLVGRSSVLRRIALLATALSLLVCFFSFVAMFQREHIEENNQIAIVFSQSVSVKSAPDAQSTDLFVIHEGVKVELLDAVSSWKKIRLADGKIGWIPEESIQTI